FADLEALRRAPRPMIAAGFGDMLGKYTCLADWHLGALLWDEPYDAEAASQAQRALAEVVAQAEAIGALQVEGIRVLMEALCASGLAMARVGHSRPASGSEHHLSHFWEQKLLSEGRPALLHGAKVGVATVLMAGAYARLRRLSRAEVARRLETVLWPSPEEQRAEIRTAYGPLADDMIADHAAFIEMLPERAAEVRERILLHWGDIQEIATSVPAPQDLADLLEHAGGVSRAEDLGLTSEEVALAYRVAHYMRARFTVRKVEIALGL
ncbi:MAG: iron-containing alcohol dehydrogenase, partial [Chloroflexi bacterium]|nr:iron-containing alcohol dehydrogenase [Chloroflexota bacterium]